MTREPGIPPRRDGFPFSRDGRQIPLDQIGHSEIRLEEPILKGRDRTPVILASREQIVYKHLGL
ncbi:hypothetical protein EJ069_13580 [Mesorhizobium sp. M2A.F.Ca.ET.043.05.1.1]|uniref:hypothetical protein n=1 Tax=unclassified Mesorhizobium TaxID=325217 RepID=UPI000F751D59|nr:MULTISPECIES: hypothetical protein [unclassified Mesorhizobium]AZO15659.1 hypothetical protein EJ069_13580 [Mesorhizobium sp. M2A.F.Ca.ET.043.05.1.1]RWD66321.1 MAG: hypothetical protein EOS37_24535 [Mesorhizobium sp.]